MSAPSGLEEKKYARGENPKTVQKHTHGVFLIEASRLEDVRGPRRLSWQRSGVKILVVVGEVSR